MDSFELEDGLVGVLGHLGPASLYAYLLKLRNLARTQSLTCLPGPALAIFLLFWPAATASDIWLKLIIVNINENIIVELSRGYKQRLRPYYS